MRLIPFLAAALVAALAPMPAAAERPAPELLATFPLDGSEVPAPLEDITLMFVSEADLVEVIIVTPDQKRVVLHDAFNRGDEASGATFEFSLPQPLTLPGTYLIEIAASVSDPADSSASALATMTSFIIPEAAPDTP